ncbi:unnamed protein product [Paramecium sonneborni]|uniref:Uncharacterized protein n=1 Tax=Paramecium sonneborni TaxID=65129 RepID=A0A8S1PBE2_9CILI|nr:unnamed protein product [Paramecium sonneborni]
MLHYVLQFNCGQILKRFYILREGTLNFTAFFRLQIFGLFTPVVIFKLLYIVLFEFLSHYAFISQYFQQRSLYLIIGFFEMK